MQEFFFFGHIIDGIAGRFFNMCVRERDRAMVIGGYQESLSPSD